MPEFHGELSIVDVKTVFFQAEKTNKNYEHLKDIQYKICAELGILICVRCHEVVTRKDAWGHYRKRHFGFKLQLLGKDILERSVKQAFESPLVANKLLDLESQVKGWKFPRIAGCQVLDKDPRTGNSYYVARKCRELYCFCCSTSTTELLKHIKKEHGLGPSGIASHRSPIASFADPVKVHPIGNHQVVVVSDSEPPVDPAAANASLAELEALQKRFGEALLPSLEEDSRRNPYFEHISNFRLIVPPEKRKYAANFGRKNSHLIDDVMKGWILSVASAFFVTTRYDFQSVNPAFQSELGKKLTAEGTEPYKQHSFRHTETQPSTYVTVYRSVVRFLFAVVGKLTAAQGDEATAQVLGEIPDEWKAAATDDIKMPVNALFDKIMEKIVDSAAHGAEETPAGEDDGEGAEMDLYLISHARKEPTAEERELGTLMADVFRALLLRRLPLGTKNPDLVEYFVVCQSLSADGGYKKQGTITSAIAGLEYALRVVSLLDAQKKAASQGDDDEAWSILDDFAVPSSKKNNVAFKLAHIKKQCRQHLPTDFTETVQQRNADATSIEVVGKDTTVHLKTVQERVSGLIESFRSNVGHALAAAGLSFREFDTESLVDDITNHVGGYSFAAASGLEDEYKAAVKSLWGGPDDPEKGVAAAEFIRYFEEVQQQIPALLYILNPPCRSTALIDIRRVNTGSPGARRTFYIWKGLMFYLLGDTKRRGIRNREDMVVKFLDPDSTQAMLNYLVYLHPMRAMLACRGLAEEKQKTVMEKFKYRLLIWPGGSSYKDSHVADLINGFLGTLGVGEAPLSISTWRHIAQFWINRLLGDTTEVERYNRLHGENLGHSRLNEAMSHSALTGQFYGLPTEETLQGGRLPVSSHQLLELADMSALWQSMLGRKGLSLAFEEISKKKSLREIADMNLPVVAAAAEAPMAAEGEAVGAPTSEKRGDTHIQQYNHTVYVIRHDSAAATCRPSELRKSQLSGALKDIFERNPFGLGEKLFENEEMSRRWVQQYTTEQSMIIRAPTGTGKSSFFQYFAMTKQKRFRVVVVIVPLVALLHDQMAKANSLGLKYALYKPDKNPKEQAQRLLQRKKRILFVQVEKVDKRLGVLLQALDHEQQLARIIVDEAHILVTDSKYRRLTEPLACIQSWRYAKTFMSATIPESMLETFREKFCTVVHNQQFVPAFYSVGGTRCNLKFLQHKLNAEGTMELIIQKIKEDWTSKPLSHFMVFCRSKMQAQNYGIKLASEFDHKVAFYHGDLSDEDRKRIQADFAGEKIRIIAGTTACCAGIHNPEVTQVFVVHGPNNITDLEQMMGRAGRKAGSVGLCHLIWPTNEQLIVARESVADEVKEIMTETSCIRSKLSEVMFGIPEVCYGSMEKCSNCEKEEQPVEEAPEMEEEETEAPPPFDEEEEQKEEEPQQEVQPKQKRRREEFSAKLGKKPRMAGVRTATTAVSHVEGPPRSLGLMNRDSLSLLKNLAKEKYCGACYASEGREISHGGNKMDCTHFNDRCKNCQAHWTVCRKDKRPYCWNRVGQGDTGTHTCQYCWFAFQEEDRCNRGGIKCNRDEFVKDFVWWNVRHKGARYINDACEKAGIKKARPGNSWDYASLKAWFMKKDNGDSQKEVNAVVLACKLIEEKEKS